MTRTAYVAAQILTLSALTNCTLAPRWESLPVDLCSEVEIGYVVDQYNETMGTEVFRERCSDNSVDVVVGDLPPMVGGRAYTTYLWSEIISAEVVISTDVITESSAGQFIIAHEFGHVLGLDHDNSLLMAPVMSQEGVSAERTIDSETESRIRDLYDL